MSTNNEMRVIDNEGTVGFVAESDLRDDTHHALVPIRLDDGGRVMVTRNSLTKVGAEIYHLSLSIGALRERNGDADPQTPEATSSASMDGMIGNGVMDSTMDGIADGAADGTSGTVKIPVVVEEARIRKELVETGKVRIVKKVSEHEQVITEELLREEVRVERVPVNMLLDGPAEIRYEGETMVIPVVEEVLVVEKRLMVKEEIRVTRERQYAPTEREVTLRSETPVIERLPADGPVNAAMNGPADGHDAVDGITNRQV